jgi:tetratricopeptide (TPR) repeat protein
MATRHQIMRGLLITLAAIAASGCATTSSLPATESIAELADVAFFPQTEYDCGPAALATVLTSTGVETTPDALVEQVYVAGLKGSLQAELMAATRRAGRVPVALDQSFDRLLDEVASGRPVLVLLNLGLKRMPVWHYAVVVGYDADANRVILRSGDEPRRRERLRRFLRQWQLADQWAFVAARPGEIPVTAAPESYVRALVDAEPQLSGRAMALAYDALLARWPENSLAMFAAANHEFAGADLVRATDLYRRVLAQEPTHVAARNNLALVLLERGCRNDALREAQLALADSRIEPFRAEIADTLTQIERAAVQATSGGVCSDS